ncbi:hypothetical protein LA345_16115 [Burkholderia vietnamiensis]|nr:hypothetical protein [Burkholderia vietnamiensis]
MNEKKELKTSNFMFALKTSMLEEMSRLKVEKDVNWSALFREFAKQKIEELKSQK